MVVTYSRLVAEADGLLRGEAELWSQPGLAGSEAVLGAPGHCWIWGEEGWSPGVVAMLFAWFTLGIFYDCLKEKNVLEKQRVDTITQVLSLLLLLLLITCLTFNFLKLTCYVPDWSKKL